MMEIGPLNGQVGIRVQSGQIRTLKVVQTTYKKICHQKHILINGLFGVVIWVQITHDYSS